MLKPPSPRFLYRAQAVGLSGVCRRPYSEHVPPVAWSVLPATGGTASAREENVRYRDILSIAKIETTVTGEPHTTPGCHKTETTVTIDGLNVRDILTADRIVGRMSARHFMDGGEACITFEGSEIVNLRIGGDPVDIQYDHPVRSEWDTFTKAKGGHRERHPKRSDPGHTLPWTIVSKLAAPAGTTVDGHCLYIPDFGTIYLGEVIIKDGHRRITMMRLALGSPVDADLNISDGDGNGQPINPAAEN
jgi:hypothetical protein